MSSAWNWRLVLALSATLQAQNPRQILEEVQQRARSTSEHYEGTLEAHDAKATISTKQWIFDRLGSSGESKSLLRFTAPQEVKGVALLIVSHPDRSSDQWIWTPAIGRERRIAMQDRSTRFFGTDFSFEDLEERDVDQFDYRMLGEAPMDGVACWKLELRPKQTKASQYTSSILWVQKEHYVIAQVESYSAGKLLRRIHYSGIAKQDKIWSAREIEVFDTVRNSRTVLKIDKLRYNVPLKAEDFTVEALRGSPAS